MALLDWSVGLPRQSTDPGHPTAGVNGSLVVHSIDAAWDRAVWSHKYWVPMAVALRMAFWSMVPWWWMAPSYHSVHTYCIHVRVGECSRVWCQFWYYRIAHCSNQWLKFENSRWNSGSHLNQVCRVDSQVWLHSGVRTRVTSSNLSTRCHADWEPLPTEASFKISIWGCCSEPGPQVCCASVPYCGLSSAWDLRSWTESDFFFQALKSRKYQENKKEMPRPL